MGADQYDPNVDPSQRDPNTGQPPGGPQYGGPRYGNQQYGGGPYGGGPYHGGRGPHHPEKQDEKEQEKQQEKGAGMDEKYHHNPVGFISWALIIIWLGVSLLLQNVHAFGVHNDDQGWAVFAWGAGVIIIVEAIIRLGIPRLRRGITGSIIWGAVAIGVGFGLWYGNWSVIGPIVVIAVGVGILLARILPRR